MGLELEEAAEEEKEETEAETEEEETEEEGLRSTPFKDAHCDRHHLLNAQIR